MRILGIDPGLKATGYGFVDYGGKKIKLFEVGVIQSRQKDPIQHRLKKIYSLLDELILKYKPEVLVLEKLYSHREHPITSSILGHVRGVICLLSSQRGVTLIEHSVKRIRKAVTGNGNASKAQVLKMVANSLGIDENRLTFDASDALALALGYIHINSCKI